MATTSTPLSMCVLLWARPGMADAMADYEDRVLALFPDHGLELLERVRGDGADGNPHEVHVFAFPSHAALDAYINDPRRTAMLGERDKVVARTETFPVTRLKSEDPDQRHSSGG